MRFLLISAFVVLPSFAFPEAVPVQAKPSQVTVYPQGARVIREGEAGLPMGAVTVSFLGIPSDADESSLRLSAQGPAGTKLFGVHLAEAVSGQALLEKRQGIESELRKLEDGKSVLEDSIGAKQAEIELLKSLGAKAAEGAASRQGGIAAFTLETAQAGKRIAVLLSAIRKDKVESRTLDEKISVLKANISNLNASRKSRSAEAELELPSAGSVRFELSYQVSSASWAPLYDLRLENSAEKPRVDLSFAANVRQKSGEDWEGVKLELSTAHPLEASAIPDPTQWWLDYEQPIFLRANAYGAALEAPAPSATMDMAEGKKAASEEVRQEAAETVSAEFSTSFSIKRLAEIPSDGSSHRVAVAESRHEADLRLIAVPRLAQAAFIEAEIKYGGEQPLLPGEAQIFRDGDFVGRTRLSTVAPAETFKLGFGQDEKVKIKRELLDTKKSEGEGFLFSKGRRVYHWVTTAESFHTGGRKLELREQLPRSRQKDIVVTALKLDPKPLPDDESRPGLSRWELNLAPKSKQKVTFRYEVKYPDDKRVTGLE
jgi:uncharacterized protein (TIGR02231 family)